MKMQVTKDNAVRYSNCRIENVPTPNFPQMVQITKGPAKLKSIVGKKYITIEKAILAIDEAIAFSLIEKEKTMVRMEMGQLGIVSIVEL